MFWLFYLVLKIQYQRLDGSWGSVPNPSPQYNEWHPDSSKPAWTSSGSPGVDVEPRGPANPNGSSEAGFVVEMKARCLEEGADCPTFSITASGFNDLNVMVEAAACCSCADAGSQE